MTDPYAVEVASPAPPDAVAAVTRAARDAAAAERLGRSPAAASAWRRAAARELVDDGMPRP